MASSEYKIRPRFRSAAAGIALLFVLIFFGPKKVPAATTHYIAANGSDSNDGASKTTPWLHLPGMTTCSSVCASYTPVAGDQFILRGGDVWTNANFPVTWTWSGSSGNPIYIGVDQTWYEGGSWTRPIFDAGDTAIPGGTNVFLHFYSQTYVVLDNIEMKGMYWSGATVYGHLAYITVDLSDYLTLENLYLHRWTHDTLANSTEDDLKVVLGNTNSPFCQHCALLNSIIQNADGQSDSGAATFAWGGSVANSVIHDLPNGLLVNSGGEIGGNLIYNILTSFSGVHENAIEDTDAHETYYIHDNVIHDVTAGLGVFIGGTATDYFFWNNVIFNFSFPVAAFDIDQSCCSTTRMYIWNNTIVSYPAGSGHGGGGCANAGHTGVSYAVLAIQNLHCLTDSAPNYYDTRLVATALTIANNTIQTPATASTRGYTSRSTYAYSPPVRGSTIGAGTNLTSRWPSGYSTSDTYYACTQQTVNGVVQSVCPARTAVSRPSSGAWSVGAYQGPVPPPPPSGLTGGVR